MIQKKTYKSPRVSIMLLEMDTNILDTSNLGIGDPGDQQYIRERNTGSFEESWEQ